MAGMDTKHLIEVAIGLAAIVAARFVFGGYANIALGRMAGMKLRFTTTQLMLAVATITIVMSFSVYLYRSEVKARENRAKLQQMLNRAKSIEDAVHGKAGFSQD
jgi:hypothetical protein